MPGPPPAARVPRFFSTLALFALAAIIVRTAWVSDDAYITFRTVDNFVHGFGLRWNVAERVQAYTHPLWMLVLSAVYFCTREIYFSSIAVSAALALSAAWLISRRIAADDTTAALAVTMLACSKAFVDYSTSGLENALTALLVVIFCRAWMTQPPTPASLARQSLIAALITLNRMDAIVLTLPALAATAFRVRRPRAALGAIARGFAPFAAWEIFSLFYYGFLFPNTAYAKLGAGLGRLELARQGGLYFMNSLANDPLTLTICGTAIALALGGARALRPIAWGILLDFVYVVAIGGDFMSGRLFVAPFVMSTVILISIGAQALEGRWPLAFLAVIGLGLAAKYPDLTSGADYGLNRSDLVESTGISDERAYYYQTSGLLTAARDRRLPDSHWSKLGDATRHELEGQAPRVLVDQHVGYYGFFAGPNLHLVDPYALADPLLARLPAERPWRIGHFRRDVPDGYVETLQANQNVIRDPSLRAYYDKLALIVHGPLLAPHRISTILKMNLGRYDGLIAAYSAARPSHGS